MNISNARYTQSGNGLPLLKLDLDGIEATIDPQQKFLGRGVVVLTLPPGSEDTLPPVSLPAVPARGIGPLTLRQATRDKEVLRLVRAFVAAVENGQLQVGPVS